MTSTHFAEFMSGYVTSAFGKDKGWVIEMTTKRDKSVAYPHPDSENKYTLLIIDTKTKEIVAKSDEFPGYNKSVWASKTRGLFIGTLKQINNEVGI